MARSERVSSVLPVPDWGTQVPHSAVKAAGVRLLTVVKVLLAGVMKSTWNLYRGQVAPAVLRKGFGAPAGGRMLPSRSPGNMKPSAVLSGPAVVTKVAVVPASMAGRSKANGCGPRYLLPAALKTLSPM